MKKSNPASVLDDPMVRGYCDGAQGCAPRGESAAYRHGYANGCDDRQGRPRERADVLRRRAEMILSVNRDT